MNRPTKHWSAMLAALALTMAAPAYGQESTGDPFLDAMMKDQQTAQQETYEVVCYGSIKQPFIFN